MYRNILVALDGSESSKRALNAAIGVVAMTNGKVTAVYVLDRSVTFSYAIEYDPYPLIDALRKDGRCILEDAQTRMKEHGISGEVELAETEGLAEDIASCLQRCAQRRAADLVVMGTHGRRGVRRAVLGSVAERFLRLSTCPVLLIREEYATD